MSFAVRDKTFLSGTHVMAILNATADSFFAPSRISGDAVSRAGKALLDGAEILDIGGQSTAPGARAVSELEESSLVLPAVEKIRVAYPDAVISVDTFYPEVARQAYYLGADMINDVAGLSAEMAEVLASTGMSVCIMHNRRGSKIPDMWLDKETGLSRFASLAVKAGVPHERIILDGGIGFNLSADEDRELLKNYGDLSFLGYPLLLGTSRKSFLGGTPDTRLTATLDTTKLAVEQDILFVRVHDVAENAAVIRTYGK